MSYPFSTPANPRPDAVFVCVPVDYIPFFRVFFEQMQRRQTWNTNADYAAAYQVFAQIEVDMMSGCVSELIAELRAARGLRPEFAATPAASRTIDMYYSLADLVTTSSSTQLEMIFKVLNNGINGILYPGEFQSSTAMRNQLAQLIQIETDASTTLNASKLIQTDMLSELVSIDGKVT